MNFYSLEKEIDMCIENISKSVKEICLMDSSVRLTKDVLSKYKKDGKDGKDGK
jgi:uncharacterized protein (DUF4415 family)